MIESGDYEEAYAAFMELGDFKDSQKYLSRFVYFPLVANYVLYDRSGVMTVELGAFNLPSRVFSVGTIPEPTKEMIAAWNKRLECNSCG